MQTTWKQTKLVWVIFALLLISSLACSIGGSPTQTPPRTKVVQVTRIITVTRIIPVTQVVSSESGNLHATYLGQDGASYAGRLCETGTAHDNLHIHLDGLKPGTQPSGYTIQDSPGTGVWATPCDPISNWLVYAISPRAGQADLYFKPYRNARDNTTYIILVEYEDGTQESTSVAVPLSGEFLGQDGGSYAGRLCTTGTTSDNIHIHLNGLRMDQPAAMRVEDRAGGGLWATPCDPVSNWQLFFTTNDTNQAELYFKPFRDAPENTLYTVTVTYSDGWIQTTAVVGWRVKP
jgi:hypothetical protein